MKHELYLFLTSTPPLTIAAYLCVGVTFVMLAFATITCLRGKWSIKASVAMLVVCAALLGLFTFKATQFTADEFGDNARPFAELYEQLQHREQFISAFYAGVDRFGNPSRFAVVGKGKGRFVTYEIPPDVAGNPFDLVYSSPHGDEAIRAVRVDDPIMFLHGYTVSVTTKSNKAAVQPRSHGLVSGH